MAAEEEKQPEVSAWIKAYLAKAKEDGWTGQLLNSGYRSYEEQQHLFAQHELEQRRASKLAIIKMQMIYAMTNGLNLHVHTDLPRDRVLRAERDARIFCIKYKLVCYGEITYAWDDNNG